MDEQLTEEETAAAQGWNADYSGPNAKTAAQFIADGEKIAPIQKERNSKLVKEVAMLSKKLDTFQDMHMKTIHETREQAYIQAKTDLKKQQIEAANEADADKVAKIQDKIENLEKPEAPKVAAPESQEVSPEFKDWAAENDWYMGGSGEDKEMTAYADMLGDKIASDYDDTPAGKKRFFKAIEAGVKKVFPGSFGSQSSNIPDVETPSGQSTKTRGAKSLPPEAKAAAEKFVKDGLYKSVDDYAKIYWGIK